MSTPALALDDLRRRALAVYPEAQPGTDVVLDPSDPHPGALEFIRKEFTDPGENIRTLHNQGGIFYAYDGTHYPELEEAAVRSRLWEFAASAKRPTKDGDLVPFQPTTSKINNMLDATRALTHVAHDRQAPRYLGGEGPPAHEMIALDNGLLHVPSRTLHPRTPRFYTHHALPFGYDVQADPPERFLRVLGTLWPDDVEAVATCQEMFGYFLLSDTALQKIFLVQGPLRSGKGTLARVLTALLGARNVCAPTLTSLSTNFGLWPLIGKLLAIVSDARLGGRADQSAIAERLLSISGEDSVTIDRKHLPPWTGRLQTRFLILTNELPRIADTSGALASRFVVLTLTRSFYGEEDTGLTAALLAELPGIFAWALEGWDRLNARGHFVQPGSSREAIRQLEDLGSPIAAFVRERCVVEPGRRAECRKVYEAWRLWCEAEGRDHPGTAQTFGRDLHAAVPGLRVTQPRLGGVQMRFYEGLEVTP